VSVAIPPRAKLATSHGEKGRERPALGRIRFSTRFHSKAEPRHFGGIEKDRQLLPFLFTLEARSPSPTLFAGDQSPLPAPSGSGLLLFRIAKCPIT
jgi:hypothetical protein